MRLKGLDLNLLIAFDILLEERSVTNAAERLHLSQPAASAALSRLREFFQDELLVLHGKRLIPTSYAESLVPEVKRILEQVDNMIAISSDFDPLKSERFFRLMASDYMLNVLVTSVVATLIKKAPGVRMDVRLSEPAMTTKFEQGKIDLMLLPEEYLSPQHPSELLFEERLVIVGWDQNPIMSEPLSEADFFDAKHVAVALGPNGDPPFIEVYMDKLGYKRQVDIYAPHFSAVPWLVQGTNRIAVIQERLAVMFKTKFPLKIATLPFDFPTMRMMAQYHKARTNDQGLRWLRDCFQEIAKI